MTSVPEFFIELADAGGENGRTIGGRGGGESSASRRYGDGCAGNIVGGPWGCCVPSVEEDRAV